MSRPFSKWDMKSRFKREGPTMPPGGSLGIPLEAPSLCNEGNLTPLRLHEHLEELKQFLSLPNEGPAETNPEGGTNHEKGNPDLF